MKRLILFITALLMAVGILNANLKNRWPSHPLKPCIHQPRIMADTIWHVSAFLGDWEHFYPSVGGRTVIRRSEDGLRDTFDVAYGLRYFLIYEWDTDNRLIAIKHTFDSLDKWDENSFIPRSEYAYDSSGRLAMELHAQYPNESYHYDYSTIIYTDSGYILNRVEYVLDSEGRLIRAGDMHYSYFEDGFTEFYFKDNSGEKTDWHFLENGYLSHCKTWKLRDGQWVDFHKEEREYRYKDDNPLKQATALEAVENRKVYGVDGAVAIQSDKPETVQIYTISGAMIRNIQTGTGSQSISLPKGFYIVMMGNQAYKVIVR